MAREGVDAWARRRVLVTGATGVIGSWLVRDLLARGAHVVTLVLDIDPRSILFRSSHARQLSVVTGSLEDPAALDRAVNVHETDTVFHLGAQTLVEVAHRYPRGTWETNVHGTWNLLEACRVNSDVVKRIVVASSDKAYGETAHLPYTEETPLAARHPYEVSKACADLIAQSYAHTYEMPVAIARCGNVYGGGDLNWSRLVPGTIRALLQGDRPVLRSDGTFVRDYLYVKDAASAYIALADAVERDDVRGQPFNFSTERPLTVLELYSEVVRLCASDGTEPIIENRAIGEIHDQTLSAEKARQVLGWSARYDLEQGLRETIEWYREFLG